MPVAPGETIHFRLGFEPTGLTLTLWRDGAPFQQVELPPSVSPSWQVPDKLIEPLVFDIFATARTHGDASYAGSLVPHSG